MSWYYAITITIFLRSESSLFYCQRTSQDLLFGGDHVHLGVEGDILGDYAAQRHVTA